MFFSYSNPDIFLKIKIFFNYFIITYLHREQHKNKQNIIKQLVCTTSSQLKFNYGIPFVRRRMYKVVETTKILHVLKTIQLAMNDQASR